MCRINILWEDETGAPQSQAGMLEDRSRSGAGISVRKPIPVGAKVKIVGKRLDFSGTVRYCRREQFKYLAGILVDVPQDLG
jgi:hypothetical protein